MACRDKLERVALVIARAFQRPPFSGGGGVEPVGAVFPGLYHDRSSVSGVHHDSSLLTRFPLGNNKEERYIDGE